MEGSCFRNDQKNPDKHRQQHNFVAVPKNKRGINILSSVPINTWKKETHQRRPLFSFVLTQQEKTRDKGGMRNEAAAHLFPFSTRT